MIPGSTDQRVRVILIDTNTRLPATGVAFDAAGIGLWYHRLGEEPVAITLVEGTGADADHADGAWNELQNGYYQVDIPDAAFAAGTDSVQIGGSATGYWFVGDRVQLSSVSASEVGFATGYAIVYDEGGVVEADVDIQCQCIAAPNGKGFALDGAVRTATSNSSGYVEFTGLVRGAKYKFTRGSGERTVIVPDLDSFEITNLLGTDA